MITNLRSSLLPNKFSPPVPREMLREHSVENIYVYVKSVKDKQPTQLFYFCLIGWKGNITFLGQQQSEVKQNTLI